MPNVCVTILQCGGSLAARRRGCAASPSQMGRFETRWLATEPNLSALADLSGQWIDLVHGRRPPRASCSTWIRLAAACPESSLRATGATLYEPWCLWHLAIAYAELGQPDDARRCIGDTIDKVERSKEKWCEASHCRRNRTQVARASSRKSKSNFERAVAVACEPSHLGNSAP
jgi:hypothetical protein